MTSSRYQPAPTPAETPPDALDGNAIGGLLLDVFGAEMTAATGTCASCGTSWPLAETVVYVHAPGVVIRCRNCRALLMVIVGVQAMNCVDVSGLASLELP
jgi:predicted RNA-binding Zn-ribbon protein involved in translation (DUF1610 family)